MLLMSLFTICLSSVSACLFICWMALYLYLLAEGVCLLSLVNIISVSSSVCACLCICWMALYLYLLAERVGLPSG